MVDGNSWFSQSQAESNGLTLPASYNQAAVGFSPAPVVDSDHTHMMQTVVWSSSDLAFSQDLANGQYSVSFWIMENWQDNARSLDIHLEGQEVISNVATMTVASWVVVSAPVTVSDGVLNVLIHADFGDPHVMGMAIFSTASASQVPLEDRRSTSPTSLLLGGDRDPLSEDTHGLEATMSLPAMLDVAVGEPAPLMPGVSDFDAAVADLDDWLASRTSRHADFEDLLDVLVSEVGSG